jgi:hypothetical protein
MRVKARPTVRTWLLIGAAVAVSGVLAWWTAPPVEPAAPADDADDAGYVVELEVAAEP